MSLGRHSTTPRSGRRSRTRSTVTFWSAIPRSYGEMQNYDAVVIDSSPVGAVADPIILSKMVHGVVLVIAAGSTDRRKVLHTVSRLREVEAEIVGSQVEGVVTLPRSAVQPGGKVLIVDSEQRLRFREIDVLRVSRDEVLVQSGLARGDRV